MEPHTGRADKEVVCVCVQMFCTEGSVFRGWRRCSTLESRNSFRSMFYISLSTLCILVDTSYSIVVNRTRGKAKVCTHTQTSLVLLRFCIRVREKEGYSATNQ